MILFFDAFVHLMVEQIEHHVLITERVCNPVQSQNVDVVFVESSIIMFLFFYGPFSAFGNFGNTSLCLELSKVAFGLRICISTKLGACLTNHLNT